MSGSQRTGTIGAAGQTNLEPPPTGKVGMYAIHFESDSFVGSVTIKGGVSGESFTQLALGYKDMETGTVATSAITGDRLVLVDAAGIGVQLDCNSYTSGDLNWAAVPLVG